LPLRALRLPINGTPDPSRHQAAATAPQRALNDHSPPQLDHVDRGFIQPLARVDDMPEQAVRCHLNV
jgi:hypothetical protein